MVILRKKVDKKTGSITYVYKVTSSDELQNMKNEVEKCNKSIEGYEKYLDWYKWNYERAKKEYEFRVQKIKDLKNFRRLLIDDINKVEGEGTSDSCKEGDENLNE